MTQSSTPSGRIAAGLILILTVATGCTDSTSRPETRVLPRTIRATPYPCIGVPLTPTTDLQAALSSNPPGTVFCLQPGTYRITTRLVPRDGQQLIGAGRRPAVISGARTVRAHRVGTRWVITGQTSLGVSAFNYPSQCRPVNGVDPKGMCVYKDQVFVNDRSLWQVGSLEELSRGEFFWNYTTNKIYLPVDPRRKKLEVSVVPTSAIGGGSRSVTIRNLDVEKFGNSVQGGAVSAGVGWTIVDNDIRLNHGGGVHMGPGTVVLSNRISHNGQIGIHGGQVSCSPASGLVVEGNEIAFNNTAGYNWGFEGGAAKWTHTDGLVVRNNYVHGNYGMGLWLDGGNIDSLLEGNTVEDNHGMGINDELGFGAVIRGNVLRGNGFNHPALPGSPWMGAGIFVDQSRDIEIYGNTVRENAAGITAIQEPAGSMCDYGVPETVNLDVHDNTVEQPQGLAAGLQLLQTGDTSYYESEGNRWSANRYELGNPGGLYFFWERQRMTVETWRSQGQG